MTTATKQGHTPDANPIHSAATEISGFIPCEAGFSITDCEEVIGRHLLPALTARDCAERASNSRIAELVAVLSSIVNGRVRISDKANDMLSEHDQKVIAARAAIARATGQGGGE